MGGRPNRHGQSRERRGDQDPREPRSEVPDTPFAEDYSLSEESSGVQKFGQISSPLFRRGVIVLEFLSRRDLDAGLYGEVRFHRQSLRRSPKPSAGASSLILNGEVRALRRAARLAVSSAPRRDRGVRSWSPSSPQCASGSGSPSASSS